MRLSTYAVLLTILGSLLAGAALAQDSGAGLQQPLREVTEPDDQSVSLTAASFVGSSACQECHEDQYQAWHDSDHRHAFAPANSTTVQGNFGDVSVAYADGVAVFSQPNEQSFLITTRTELGQTPYPVRYTLGHYPLQQYLLETEPGRFQVFALAWDTRPESVGGQRWIEIQPEEAYDEDNPLHWTGYFQNWNSQCADCHTTDFDKGYQAATAEASASYQSRWSEAGVGCEACHGPASQHMTWASNPNSDSSKGFSTSPASDRVWTFRQGESIASLASSSQAASEAPHIRTCARCHSLRHPLGNLPFERVPSTDEFSNFTDHFYPQLVSEPHYFSDGQIREEAFVYGSFLQSKMHNAGVTCGDCHDAHSGKVYQFDEEQIASPENDAVCTRCHLADTYAATQHHQHPKNTEAARCVTCHMPATTYMLVDPRRDHSFSVPSPILSNVTDTPNACTGCHTTESNLWAAQNIENWQNNKAGKSLDFASWQVRAAQIPAHADQQQWLQLETKRHELISADTTPEMKRAMLLQTMPVFDRQSFNTLADSLSDKDVVVRLAAIDQLSAAEPETRASLLTPLLNDASRSVRLNATLALADLLLQPSYREKDLLQRRVDEYVATYQNQEDLLASQLRLAAIYRKTSKHMQAADAYIKALDLVPGVVVTMINLADTYRALSRDDEGEKVLLQAVAIAERESDNPVFRYADAALGQQSAAHYSLGLLYTRKDDHNEALNQFLSAVTLQPLNDQYFYAYLLTLDALGRRDEALEELEYSPIAHQSQLLQQLALAWRRQ